MLHAAGCQPWVATYEKHIYAQGVVSMSYNCCLVFSLVTKTKPGGQSMHGHCSRVIAVLTAHQYATTSLKARDDHTNGHNVKYDSYHNIPLMNAYCTCRIQCARRFLKRWPPVIELASWCEWSPATTYTQLATLHVSVASSPRAALLWRAPSSERCPRNTSWSSFLICRYHCFLCCQFRAELSSKPQYRAALVSSNHSVLHAM